jgi:glycosyltransferase involved in cell wall biosynthesis
LSEEFSGLCDEVSQAWNTSHPAPGSLFLSLSPMTHSPNLFSRMLGYPSVVSAAVVYDFIPLDWPFYLNSVSSRVDYASKLFSLKSFDLLLPISNYSSARAQELLGFPAYRLRVTGVAARPVFFAKDRPEHGNPYFLVVSGQDRRKNLEAAVQAVSKLNQELTHPIPLRIVGITEKAFREDFGQAEGALLQFLPHVSDGVLAEHYSGALATIVPSHIEGFSLPVVEASASGSPVLASRCAAHTELISNPDALFAAESPDELLDRLKQVLFEPGYRERILTSQSHIAGEFEVSKVGARFWDFLYENVEARFESARALAVHRGSKPRVAFLSPYPPDRTGVAWFSELTLEAARTRFDIDLFTNAFRPVRVPEGVRDAGPIGLKAMMSKRYDSVISVLGNSDYHTPVFELFENYGGPCILHDSRLTHVYHFRHGRERFRDMASGFLTRPVSDDEIENWLNDRDVATLFVEPVVVRARPLIVHTKRFATILAKRYGARAEVATSPPNLNFAPEELAEPNRTSARRRLGLDNDVFAVGTFGFAGRQKGSAVCVLAIALLRSWGIKAELHFVGSSEGLQPILSSLASELGVADAIHFGAGFVDAATYRDFLLACDAAVQLRTYGFGQMSAALTDCIGAAVPVVATTDLAESVDAPSYVKRIPDHISPLLVAECLAGIYEQPRSRAAGIEERNEYCRLHSFAYYAQRLEEILALG